MKRRNSGLGTVIGFIIFFIVITNPNLLDKLNNTIDSVTGKVETKYEEVKEIIKDGSKEVSEKTKDDTSKINKSLNDLLASIKSPIDNSNIQYNRDSYTSEYQYYEYNNEEFYSIRNYAHSASIYNNNGIYTDPYSNLPLNIKDADFDHIIPLAYADRNGSNSWKDEEKRAFADNPEIGVNVHKSLNRGKGSKGPSQWLPEYNKENYCYSWLVIAKKYNLTIEKEDLIVINEILKDKDINKLEFMGTYKK